MALLMVTGLVLTALQMRRRYKFRGGLMRSAGAVGVVSGGGGTIRSSGSAAALPLLQMSGGATNTASSPTVPGISTPAGSDPLGDDDNGDSGGLNEWLAQTQT